MPSGFCASPATLRLARARTQAHTETASPHTGFAALFPWPAARRPPPSPPPAVACAQLAARLSACAPLISLSHAPGAGRCLTIARAVPAGTLLLCEPAAAFARRPVEARGDARALVARLEGGCASCASPSAVLCLALALAPHAGCCGCDAPWCGGACGRDTPPADASAESILAPAIRRNAFRARPTSPGGIPPSSDELTALFPAAALANHSCAPTATYSLSWAPCVACAAGTATTPTLSITALTPLAAGDEVTIAYVDVDAATADRLVRLRDAYGFICSCPKCALKEPTDAPA